MHTGNDADSPEPEPSRPSSDTVRLTRPPSSDTVRLARPGADAAPPTVRPSSDTVRIVRPGADTVRLEAAAVFDSLGIASIPLPEFHELANLIYENFGIMISDKKLTLVTGRIHPMLEKYGFRSHRAFIDALKADRTGELLSELANRISTNHTAFYREEAHFSFLRKHILPEMAARKKAARDYDLRVWCAASATGEEAYTILFTLMEFFGQEYSLWRAGVLATDISANALEAGKRGRYSAERIEPVPPELRARYFDRVGEGEYEVKPEVRREVTFRRLNLNTETYPFKNKFDIIFCRNVMIYFSRPIRLRLVERLREWLVPGGVLLVGHSESLVGQQYGLEYLGPAMYMKPARGTE